MASGENFCLRLNEFESNVKIYWQQLQVEKDFSDVTLVCDDGHIKSHKIIISRAFTDVHKSNKFLYETQHASNALKHLDRMLKHVITTFVL